MSKYVFTVQYIALSPSLANGIRDDQKAQSSKVLLNFVCLFPLGNVLLPFQHAHTHSYKHIN